MFCICKTLELRAVFAIGTACLVCYFHAETPSGFFGNLSGKTKQSVMFEIKFVSRFLVFLLQNVM
jgi:hypothetical protein